jgi:hypothetical protein
VLAIYGRNAIRPGTNTSTAQTFPFVWAPTADGNRPDAYGDAIVAAIERFMDLDKAPVDGPAPRPVRFEAAFDDTRLRAGPTLKDKVLRSVDTGFTVTAERTVKGDRYEAEGRKGDTWLKIIEVRGKAVHPPVFSASVLWRRA